MEDEDRNKDIQQLTLSQQTHENIRVEGTLVSFVENDDAVPIEISLVERLSQHDTISHVYTE
jgi:hypothetical protein